MDRPPPLDGVPTKAVEGRDGVWLQDSPANLMVINAVYTLDSIDLEALRRLWDERVMQAGDGQRYPRLKRRVVWRRSRPYWQDDPAFALARHVFIPENDADLRTKESLQEYVGELASQPLPDDRSPWQMQLIPEFGDGGSAIIFRIHHCMGDGIGLIPILFSLMDAEPEGGGMVFPAVIDKDGKPPNKLLLALHAAVVGPFLLLQKMLWRPDKNRLHGRALSGTKRVAWTDPIDLGVVKEVKNRLGATVNDVLVACVAGAFQRYLARHADEELKRLRVSMPVNVRSRFEELKMDNKFAAVLLPLPVVADVRERIAATRQVLNRLKRSIEPFFTYAAVIVLLKFLPPAVSRFLIDFLASKCTAVLTNVPGPQMPVYVTGRRLRAMLFWVPQRAKVGIGVSILTLTGSLRVGVIADTALIADPGLLVEAFDEEFRELRESVSAG